MKEAIELYGKETEDDLKTIARGVFSVINTGGLALLPDGIGYGLVGHSSESVRRVYDLKGRSLSKPLTHYMGASYVSNIANINNTDIQLIERITRKVPCCFIIPYKDSAYFENLERFTFEQSTKSGTVALFFERDDPLVNKILELTLPQEFALIVSSANLTGQGNTYRFEEVPKNIRESVDICIYSQTPCKYELEAQEGNKKNGSTLVRLSNRQIIRKGVLSNLIDKMLGE